MPKQALIAGASGLVGEQLLLRLLAAPDYDQVISIGRRMLPISNLKLKQIAVDFATLQTVTPTLHVDDVFCALGTTIGKAGSKAAFRAVDYDAVLNVARLGLSLGATGFYLVSALGANTRSRLFYSQTKGEVEEALGRLGYRTLVFAHPSLLKGNRREFRLGEQVAFALAAVLHPFLVGPLDKYRPTRAEDVARALLQAAQHAENGVHVLEPAMLR